MPNLIALVALVCTLSARRLVVAGNARVGIESPPEPSVRVTETGDGSRTTVVLWGKFQTVEISHLSPQFNIRKITKGHDELVLIYKGHGNLVACELFKGDAVELSEFHQSFSKEARKVEDEEESERLSKFLDGHPDIDRSLVDWDASEKSCVRLQAAKQDEAQSLQKSDEDEEKRKTGRENEVNVPSRTRRSIMWPGTTWCGIGNVSRANDVHDGAQVGTDRCCQQHDMCNYTIEAFTSKYNLLNFRFHTISHCECDDRFRTCLRMASTPDNPHSDTVGRLFFNIIGMKCFVFERELVCQERHWWGGCKRQGYQLSAKLRESVPYYTNDD